MGCPAMARLKAARLACLVPASPHPVGWVEGRAPAGWEVLAKLGERTLTRAPSVDCGQCPMKDWPQAMPVLGVEVDSRGLLVRFLFDDGGALSRLCESLRAGGHVNEVVACSPRFDPPASIPRLIDLSGLTQKQRETLLCAVRIGYFDTGNRAASRALAQALGCSQATANEHLRKAMSKLSSAWATGEGASTPVASGATAC